MGRSAFFCLIALALGACGDGEPTGPPVPPGALAFDVVDAGYLHACGLARAGQAYCWGGNAFGSIGDGTATTRLAPTRVAGNHRFVALDVGAAHACALTGTGDAWCWGYGDEGQLGAPGGFIAREPVAVAGGHAFTAISAGHAHSCGLTEAGVAWCWGDDSAGQLGDGAAGVGGSDVPVRVQFALPFASVHAGYYQTCGLTADGAAWCWGMGVNGQNGDGTTESRTTPVAVGGGHAFDVMALGDRFVCASNAEGTWCWGANRAGERGAAADGDALPTALADGRAYRAVAASAGASTVHGVAPYGCGVRAGGRASCWGGSIGGLREPGPDRTDLDDRIPFASIAAGPSFLCGLDTRGHAWCGGANSSGQLGDGTQADRATMVAVAAPSS